MRFGTVYRASFLSLFLNSLVHLVTQFTGLSMKQHFDYSVFMVTTYGLCSLLNPYFGLELTIL